MSADMARRAKKPCTITGCAKQVKARDLCGMHYWRLMAAGDPLLGGMDSRSSRPPHERVLDRIVKEPSGCWRWDGASTGQGYGQIYDTASRKNVMAHRAVYEGLVGPIPDGLELDHLCRVRGCVNPEHLEPVTRGENIRRAWEARRAEGKTA